MSDYVLDSFELQYEPRQLSRPTLKQKLWRLFKKK